MENGSLDLGRKMRGLKGKLVGPVSRSKAAHVSSKVQGTTSDSGPRNQCRVSENFQETNPGKSRKIQKKSRKCSGIFPGTFSGVIARKAIARKAMAGKFGQHIWREIRPDGLWPAEGQAIADQGRPLTRAGPVAPGQLTRANRACFNQGPGNRFRLKSRKPVSSFRK